MHALKLLERFNVYEAKPAPTPVEPGMDFTQDNQKAEDEEQLNKIPYQEAILSVCTKQVLDELRGSWRPR
ncbi:unnamed protein product [Nezara viridula]|uniref:Uncharacterized protein n=1 Tax=Nezara viridula TaxID=85310 RepID=A0A9P0EFF6_NEZVI|nr:unnamed protein product [Nezara viridula]